MARLTDFEVLSFDCYGTLIDWETGIWQALAPWLRHHGTPATRDEVLEAFAVHESAQEAETPDMLYPEVLYNVHRRLASQWQVDSNSTEAMAFARSVQDWPAFADSAEALGYLKEHFRLVVLSNVDRDSFAASQRKLGVTFDAVYTAQDIGSYKPDPRNFEFMVERLHELGYAKSTVLHTAQSLYHDHVPAARIGLATNRIDRRHDEPGWGATLPSPVECNVDFTHASMAEFVRAHRSGVAVGV